MDGTLKINERNGRLLSEQEAIDYLSLSGRPNPKGALHWLMRARGLAYVRLARGIHGFRQADLDGYINSSRVAAGPGQ